MSDAAAAYWENQKDSGTQANIELANKIAGCLGYSYIDSYTSIKLNDLLDRRCTLAEIFETHEDPKLVSDTIDKINNDILKLLGI